MGLRHPEPPAACGYREIQGKKREKVPPELLQIKYYQGVAIRYVKLTRAGAGKIGQH
jgi:hypothetical protein